MKIESKANCPLNKFAPCKQTECAWFIQLRGQNPNTGKEIDEWGCAISWLPILLVENSQQQRQTAAAVESHRNVALRIAQDQFQRLPSPKEH